MKRIQTLLMTGFCLLAACDPPPPPSSHGTRVALQARELHSAGAAFGSHPVCDAGVDEEIELFNEDASSSRMILYAEAPPPFKRTAILSADGGTQQLPLSLAPGAGVKLRVRFTPQTPESFKKHLTVFSDEPGAGVINIPLEGQGVGPRLVLSPPSLDLSLPGDASDAGTPESSVERTVTVRNIGNESLSSLVLHPPAAPFSAELDKTALEPGETASLKVTFTPGTSKAFFTDALTVSSNDPCSPVTELPLAGFLSSAPRPALSPTALAFPEQEVGMASAHQQVMVTNEGGSLLTISSVSLQDASDAGTSFSVSPSGGFTLEPGKSRPLAVKFTPTAPGTHQATLQLVSDGQGSPSSVLLSGDAVQAATLKIEPASVRFAVQVPEQTTTENLSVQNTGSRPVTVSVAVTSTDEPAAFKVTPTSLSLLPGATGTLVVTLTPSANRASGPLLGQLTLRTGDSTEARQIHVALQGEVVRTRVVPAATDITFNDHVVGAPSQQRELVLKNPTTLPVTVDAIAVGSLRQYAVTGLPVTIPPNETRSAWVVFSPSERGQWDHTLQLKGNATETIPPVSLRGKALAPVLTIPDASLNLSFDTTAPGAESLKQVTLTNSGDAPLTIEAATVSEDTHFKVRGVNPPRTVDVNKSLTFDVIFNPKSLGPKEATLRFHVDNSGLPLGAPQIKLSGLSSGPFPVFEPGDQIDFGAQQVNSQERQKIRITNSESALETLQILSITIKDSASGFSLGKEYPSQDRKPGDYLDVEVVFDPRSVGTRYTDTLSIEYQGATTKVPRTKTLALKGTGAAAVLQLSETSVQFKDVELNTVATAELTLTNKGGAPLHLETISISGAGASAFQLGLLNWPKPLAPEGKEVISVMYKPTKVEGVTANLIIRSNAMGDNVKNGETQVQLSGQGTASLAVFSTRKVSFGSTPIGGTSSRELTISNEGSAPLRISEPEPSTHFYVSNEGVTAWPVDIPAKANGQPGQHVFRIVFRPDSKAEVSETISFVSNDSNSPVAVTLSGRGAQPLLVVDSSFSLGDDLALDVEALRNLSLRNEGDSLLEIRTITVAPPFCFVLPTTGTCVTQTSGDTRLTIEPGGTKELQLRATPRTHVRVSGLLSFTTNEQGSRTDGGSATRTVTVSFKGKGEVSTQADALDFGPCVMDASAIMVDKEVSISNTSASATAVTEVILSGDDVPDFEVVRPLPELPAESARNLTLRFKPQKGVAGLRQAVASIHTRNNPTPVVLNLQGYATVPELTIRRKDGKPFTGKVDFKGTLTNSTSEPVVLVFSNGRTSDAGGPLTISVNVTGMDASSFGLSKTGPLASLAPGESAELAVQFKPGADVKGYEAALSVTTNDPTNLSFLVKLSGTGVSKALSLSTNELNFGSRLAGVQTSSQPVRLSNDSGHAIVLTQVHVEAPEGPESTHFMLEPGPWTQGPYTLESGATLNLPVTFQPRPDVESESTLLIATEGPNASHLSVKLKGRGLSSVFRDLRRLVNFGTQRLSDPHEPEVLALTNDSSGTLFLTKYVPEGPQGDHFRVEPDDESCRSVPQGIELRTGETCKLEVSYVAQQVTRSAAPLLLSVSSEEAGPRQFSSARVELKGEKVSSLLSADPMELDFGWVDLGKPVEPRLITLTNKSSVATRVQHLQVSNPEAFKVEALEPGKEIPPEGTAQLRVTFEPKEGADVTGQVELRLEGEQVTDVAIQLHGK
ncbi:choice-of-anchor D domain-containing protein, partial [Pyxidicoccus fallax]